MAKFEKTKKALVILLKVIRWPLTYLLPPVIISLLFHAFTGNENIENTMGEYGIQIAVIIVLFAFLEGIFTSSVFTDSFLASTGLAAGIFLVASLFFSVDDFDSPIEYDTMKMMAVFILIGAVLLGDISVMLVKKIGRYFRNKKISR